MAATVEMSDSLGQLVEKSKAGCLASFEQIVRMHEKAIFNYLLQLTRNSHDAEDVAQETFVKAFQNLERFDEKYRFSTWLFTIAKRTAISHYRRSRDHEPLEDFSDLASADTRDYSDSGDLWLLARRLKPKLFEALWLHYGEGFDVREVARIMGSNSIYVKVLLHRARNELKKKLKTPEL